MIKKSKKNSNKLRIALIVLVTCIFAVVIFLSAFVILYKPDVDTNVPFETEEGDSTDDSENGTDESAVETSDTKDTEADASGEYKLKEDMFTFLVLGRDRAASLTDVIMLVSYDVKNGKAALMQIPRDTYVEINSHAYKINTLYATLRSQARKDGEADPHTVAINSFVSILEKSLCININYYVMMDLDGFANIVDAVGGVDVNIPSDMKYEDPEQDLYIDLKAGPNHLNGAKAEQFVRFREGFMQADLGRINAQKIFMSAFLDSLQKNMNIDTITSIAKQIFEYVKTDISLADCIYFGKAILNLDLGNMSMMTLPGYGMYIGKASFYVLHRADTLAAVNEYFNIYETVITDSIFDKDLIYLAESDAEASKFYYGEAGTAVTADEFSAEEINENSIDIPRN